MSGLPDIPEPSKDLQVSDYLPFLTVLFKNFTFIKALSYTIDQADYDNLAKCIVSLSMAFGQTLPMTKEIIESEFERNLSTPGSILRGNCVASKVMGAFSRMVGKEWMNACLGSIVQQLVADESFSLEIDPSKIKETESVDENLVKLKQKCESIFLRIIDDEVLDVMPMEIKVMSGYTAQMAQKYAEDRMVPLIGGFLFLRLVNPALITPETFGVLPPGVIPGKNSRRNLTLISKILQNLSNGVEFGKKEPYMTPCNDFIINNQARMDQYLSKLAEVALQSIQNIEGNTFNINEDQLKLSDVQAIHKMIFSSRSKIEAPIAEEFAKLPDDGTDHGLAEFLSLFDALGPPASAAPKAGFAKKAVDIEALMAQADALEKEGKKKKKDKPKEKKTKEKDPKEPKEAKEAKEKKKRRPKRKPSTARAFGRGLDEIEELPDLIGDTISVLEGAAMETEGLFRKTASMAAVADLVQQYESGKDINWYQIDDYHLIAGVLMNYLLKLPEPVFPFDAYDSVIEAVSGRSDVKSQVDKLKAILSELPELNYELLEQLIDFMDTITYDAEDNLMNADNLAVCFSPALLRLPPEDEDISRAFKDPPFLNRAISLLVQNFGYVFKDEPFEEEESSSKAVDPRALKMFASDASTQFENCAKRLGNVISELEWPEMWTLDNLSNLSLVESFLLQLLENRVIDASESALSAAESVELPKRLASFGSTPVDKICSNFKTQFQNIRNSFTDLGAQLIDNQKQTADEILTVCKMAKSLKLILDYMNSRVKLEKAQTSADPSELRSVLQAVVAQVEETKQIAEAIEFYSDAVAASRIVRATQKALKDKSKSPIDEIKDNLRREAHKPGEKPARSEFAKSQNMKDNLLEYSMPAIEQALGEIEKAIDDPEKVGDIARDIGLLKEIEKAFAIFLMEPLAPEPEPVPIPVAVTAPPPVSPHPRAGGAGGPPPTAPHPRAGGSAGGPPPTAPHPRAGGGAGGPPPTAPHPKAMSSGAPPPVAPHPKASGSGGAPPPTAPHPRAAGNGVGGPPPTAPHPRSGSGGAAPPPTAPHPRAGSGPSSSPSSSSSSSSSSRSPRGGSAPSTPGPTGPPVTAPHPKASGSGGPPPIASHPRNASSGSLMPSPSSSSSSSSSHRKSMGPAAGMMMAPGMSSSAGVPPPGAPHPRGPRPVSTGPLALGKVAHPASPAPVSPSSPAPIPSPSSSSSSKKDKKEEKKEKKKEKEKEKKKK